MPGTKPSLHRDATNLPSTKSCAPTKNGFARAPVSALYDQTVTQEDIAWLWLNLTKAFGYKFINNYGKSDDGIWFTLLSDLKRADLAYGFWKVLFMASEQERQSKEAWPPNAKEFRLYCERRFEDYGLPPAHKAYYEIENNRWLSYPLWSHPLVCLAASLIEGEEEGSDCYQTFCDLYASLTERYMRGEPLKLPACCLLPGAQSRNRVLDKQLQELRKIEQWVYAGI